jgi:glycolate oxidase
VSAASVIPSADLASRMAAIVGVRHVIVDGAELSTYECDGLTGTRVRPRLVVLPASTGEVAAVLRAAADAGVPVVARGAGTGLSGGALPVADGIVVSLSRMRRILETDLENGWVRVEPGVINLDVSKAIASDGYYYAPDPSSQGVCTIGGNVAENSGGAHCLKYGFTVHHVLGMRMVLADGSVVDLGGTVLDSPGYDLPGVVVGSEGLLGIVTEVVLRVLRKPEATRTFFATFPSTDEAGAAVSAIIASGIVPAAIEMMDRLAIEAARAATGLDWPDVGAALLMDADGPLAEVEHRAENAIALARRAGAIEVRRPQDEAERALMWKGRKSAFAAVGRISPNYFVQDGVIPRSEIAAVLREIGALAAAAGLRVANVFHAGDGNLHPLILYDRNVPGQERAAEELGGEILRLCVRYGGSITGERCVQRVFFPNVNAATIRVLAAEGCEVVVPQGLLRRAFDPRGPGRGVAGLRPSADGVVRNGRIRRDPGQRGGMRVAPEGLWPPLRGRPGMVAPRVGFPEPRARRDGVSRRAAASRAAPSHSRPCRLPRRLPPRKRAGNPTGAEGHPEGHSGADRGRGPRRRSVLRKRRHLQPRGAGERRRDRAPQGGERRGGPGGPARVGEPRLHPPDRPGPEAEGHRSARPPPDRDPRRVDREPAALHRGLVRRTRMSGLGIAFRFGSRRAAV